MNQQDEEYNLPYPVVEGYRYSFKKQQQSTIVLLTVFGLLLLAAVYMIAFHRKRRD